MAVLFFTGKAAYFSCHFFTLPHPAEGLPAFQYGLNRQKNSYENSNFIPSQPFSKRDIQ
ncbi:hypothetical protein [Adhaeribacter rhizoryzae]|uniref:hypothetical protein n=1 Tax=Adhaeribacter rhizoryzae TaxID=2607907 RepID=UPI00167FDF76|nr:hypothetical protein [Adhaeribacter rhizoryzae]